jgi:hypothetical protein
VGSTVVLGSAINHAPSVFLPWRYRHWTSGNCQSLKFQIIATAVGTIATLSPRMPRAIATFSVIATIATIKNTT